MTPSRYDENMARGENKARNENARRGKTTNETIDMVSKTIEEVTKDDTAARSETIYAASYEAFDEVTCNDEDNDAMMKIGMKRLSETIYDRNETYDATTDDAFEDANCDLEAHKV